MRKILQFILTIILGIGISFMSGNIAQASEEKSIKDNRIKFPVTYTEGFTVVSHSIGFYDTGYGSLELKLFETETSNNQIITPLQHARLAQSIEITLLDKNDNIYFQKSFLSWSSLSSMWSSLRVLRINYGDKIRVQVGSKAKYSVGILGTIHSNLDSFNFNERLDEHIYQLRMQGDGLYAEYINQTRIPDGEYIIETAEDTNRVLDVAYGNNVSVNSYNPGKRYQKFNLEYNNTHKAYKVKVNHENRVLNWNYNSDNNVNSADDKGSAGEQFWYLQKTNDGRYKLINARDVYKTLNLDSNNTNISVADDRNNLKQQFKFVNSRDKELSYITQGSFMIASKLNNNKVLDINSSTNLMDDVTIWDKNNGFNQHWRFEYDANKDAYKIRSILSHKKVLSPYSHPMYGDNVSTDSDKYASDISTYYWKLNFTEDGYCTITNYEYRDMVLTLSGSNTNNGSNIIINERKDTDNQKWSLVRN